MTGQKEGARQRVCMIAETCQHPEKETCPCARFQAFDREKATPPRDPRMPAKEPNGDG